MYFSVFHFVFSISRGIKKCVCVCFVVVHKFTKITTKLRHLFVYKVLLQLATVELKHN